MKISGLYYIHHSCCQNQKLSAPVQLEIAARPAWSRFCAPRMRPPLSSPVECLTFTFSEIYRDFPLGGFDCIHDSCSLERMSTNGDVSPKEDKEHGETSLSPSVTKGDSALLQAPNVPGHQDFVDAVWPILMKGVEGMYSKCVYIH